MKVFKSVTVQILTSALLASPLAVWAAGAGADAQTKAKPYPLGTCVVSGEKLGEMGEAYVFRHEGREFKLCCKDCLSEFNKDKAKYVAKWDAAAKKVKPYPLKACLVSDEAFGGDMGEPYVFVHELREIKLCCKSCLKDFKKDTTKYLQKFDEAFAKAKK